MQDKHNDILNGQADAIKVRPPYDGASIQAAYGEVIALYRRELERMQRDIDWLRCEVDHWRKSQDYWMNEAMKAKISAMTSSFDPLQILDR